MTSVAILDVSFMFLFSTNHHPKLIRLPGTGRTYLTPSINPSSLISRSSHEYFSKITMPSNFKSEARRECWRWGPKPHFFANFIWLWTKIFERTAIPGAERHSSQMLWFWLDSPFNRPRSFRKQVLGVRRSLVQFCFRRTRTDARERNEQVQSVYLEVPLQQRYFRFFVT